MSSWDEDWLHSKTVCVLGAGDKPLTEDNTGEFVGIEGMSVMPVNVDIRACEGYIVQDLSLRHWENLKSNWYDIVIAEHVAEHVPDRLAFIGECLRILHKGGLLIIEVPNWKHLTAHSNLEHLTTWSRVIFDDCYVNDFGKKWKVEKKYYRITLFWKSFYVKWGFLGRQIDRFTGLVSGIRFFVRKP